MTLLNKQKLNTPPASPHSPCLPKFQHRQAQGENKNLPLKGVPRFIWGRDVPLIVAIAILFVLILGNHINAQSIEDYQQIAAENNPEVRSAFHQYLASLEEPDQIGALPDPEVAFAYFISPIETRVGPQQARISLTQMLPWFGTLGNKREIANIQSRAHFETFRETRNRIFYQTEKTFLDLYELDRSIDIAEENLEILNSLVEISLRRYETNQATQVDVLRAQIEQEDLKTQLALLQDNRSVLEQRISELLNTSENIQIHAPDTLHADVLLDDSQSLRNQLMQENPVLSRLRYQEESSREMRDLAAKDGKPSFGIGADYIFTGERTDMAGLTDNGKDALIARASFRIPLFRNKYNAQVQQAEQNIQAMQMQISSKENSLETDLDESLRDYYDAERQFQLYDQTQIQRVNQALTIMMQAYSTDSSNFEEILRMQRKLLDYQLNRIQALTDMHKAAAYIEYLTGQNNINPNEIE